MKRIQVAVLIFLALPFGNTRAQSADPELLQQAIVIAMLTDDNPGKVRLGARNIRKFYANNEQLTDCVAERLLNVTTTEPKDGFVTAALWLIASLGELQNPRYLDTLKTVRDRTDIKDIDSAVDDFVKLLGQKQAAPYVQGSADLARMRADALRLLEAGKKSDRSAFANLKQGASLAEMLSALGSPDDLTLWHVRSDKLAVHYAGAGFFLMSVEQEAPPRYIVMQAVPELLSVSSTYKGPNFGSAQILGSSIGRPLVQYFKSDRRVRTDMDAMYILVRRILELPVDDLHRYDEAMYKIALGLLWKSQDPRGKQWVQLVANMPGKNSIQRFAKKVVESGARRKANAQEPLSTPAGNAEDTTDDGDDLDTEDDNDSR